VRDYETICDVTDSSGEEAIESMIEIASNDAEKSVLKSSYSSTQIVSEIENIATVNEFNKLLKNMNVFLENNRLNPLLRNNNLILFYKGVNKKNEKYTQRRWTKTGKEYILKALKAYTTIVEPLLIAKTQIKEYNQGDYYLKVMDQYGRWWEWKGENSNKKQTFIDMQKILADELKKTIIDIDLYNICDREVMHYIKRHEEVLYIYSNFYEEMPIDGYVGCVRAITKDCLVYEHERLFDDYENLKKFALKIKDRGIINLEFWECLYIYDFSGHEYEEFEKRYNYCDPEDKANQDVLDMIESDRMQDGTVPGYR
jgi:hypothetical protein